MPDQPLASPFFGEVRALLAGLRAERLSQERTLEDVAHALGVSFQLLAFWETGARRPSVDQMRSWARSLRLPDDLVTQYAELRTIEGVDDLLRDHGVDDEGRSAVRVLVRGVLQRPRPERQRSGAAASGS